MKEPLNAKSQSGEELTPELGAINTVVACRAVSNMADAETKGSATAHALMQLMRDVGAAVMQMALETNGGTIELQLAVRKEEQPLDGLTNHVWRVDVWKARQRQLVFVPVRIADPLANVQEFPEGAGAFQCTHCGEGHSVPAFVTHNLPRKKAVPCSRCTLPIFILLVDADQVKKPQK